MITRRAVLASSFTPIALASRRNKAQIAITLDLEMSRNFPVWTDTHWDYEKGNLNEAAKSYAVQVADRVRERGGLVHFFVVGQVFEQEDISWLEHIAHSGHSIGNHTYDHINLLARAPSELQFRFRRAPWLIEGLSVSQAIERNIRMTSQAMRTRLHIVPNGFRIPGGFPEGLVGREDLQRMLLSLGFTWVSSKYLRYRSSNVGETPDESVLSDIVRAVRDSQPFQYPQTGVIEIPMTPVSDIDAFRNGRWKLESFLTAIRRGIEDTIEQGGSSISWLILHALGLSILS